MRSYLACVGNVFVKDQGTVHGYTKIFICSGVGQ